MTSLTVYDNIYSFNHHGHLKQYSMLCFWLKTLSLTSVEVPSSHCNNRNKLTKNIKPSTVKWQLKTQLKEEIFTSIHQCFKLDDRGFVGSSKLCYSSNTEWPPFGHFSNGLCHKEPVQESKSTCCPLARTQGCGAPHTPAGGSGLCNQSVCAAGCARSATVWAILDVFQGYWCRQGALPHHTRGCN